MRARGRKQIKIGHVVHRMGFGGLESVVAALVEGTAEENFASCVYALAGGGELMRRLEERGHETRILRKKTGLDPFLAVRLAGLLNRDDIDVVHCHNFGAFAYGGPAGKIARIGKILYTAHGPAFPDGKRQRLFQRLPLAERVVTVSEFLRRGAIEAGLDPSRVVTIRNGVDPGRFTTRSPQQLRDKRAEIGIGEGDLVVGIVARLSPEKDHATLLDAFSRVASARPEARLVIVGDGELRNALVERCARLAIGRLVSFLGDRADVADLLGIFDVFALPSKEEGLGITLLEAMAAGVPVVAARVGGIPEIVENGETGMLVPPGDSGLLAEAIEWVMSHGDAAAAMADLARRRVAERFSVTRMIRSYEDLYASGVSNG